MSAEMTPRLQSAFAALRQESAMPPRPVAMAVARAAMHDAAGARGRARLALLPLFAARLRRGFTPVRLLATGGGLVTGLAVVAVLGWNAPAGTPLHVVRLAHEQIALVVPGADQTGLELSYAESRLRDAVQGTSTAASLDEAARLLADVHGRLPANHGSALWSRWQDDQNQLDGLRQRHGGEDGGGPGGPDGAPAPAGGASHPSSSSSPDADDHHGGPGSTDPGAGGAPAGGHGGGSGRPGGSPGDGSQHSSSSSTSSGTRGGDHGGSSSSSTSTSTSRGGSSSSNIATTETTTTTTTSSASRD